MRGQRGPRRRTSSPGATSAETAAMSPAVAPPVTRTFARATGAPVLRGHAGRDRVSQLGQPPHVRVAVDAGEAGPELLRPAARGSGAPRVPDVERKDLALVRRHAAEERGVGISAERGERRARWPAGGARPDRIARLDAQVDRRAPRRPDDCLFAGSSASSCGGHRGPRPLHPSDRSGRASSSDPRRALLPASRARGLDPVREPRHPPRARRSASTCRRSRPSSSRRGAAATASSRTRSSRRR